MENTGVTPEQLLREFGALVGAQTKSLRALAEASGVGVETIRGWKDAGRFPRSTDDFMKVVRTCRRFPHPQRQQPRWQVSEWEVRYQEAKRIWENRESEPLPRKPIAATAAHPSPAPQVYGGDYVNGDKPSLHIGDVNHHHPGR